MAQDGQTHVANMLGLTCLTTSTTSTVVLRRGRRNETEACSCSKRGHCVTAAPQLKAVTFDHWYLQLVRKRHRANEASAPSALSQMLQTQSVEHSPAVSQIQAFQALPFTRGLCRACTQSHSWAWETQQAIFRQHVPDCTKAQAVGLFAPKSSLASKGCRAPVKHSTKFVAPPLASNSRRWGQLWEPGCQLCLRKHNTKRKNHLLCRQDCGFSAFFAATQQVASYVSTVHNASTARRVDRDGPDRSYRQCSRELWIPTFP